MKVRGNRRCSLLIAALVAGFSGSFLCGCSKGIVLSFVEGPPSGQEAAVVSADPVAYWNFDGQDPKLAALSGGMLATGGPGTQTTDRLASVPAGTGKAIKLDYQSILMQAPLPSELSDAYSIEFSLKFGTDAFRNSVIFPNSRPMNLLMSQTGMPITLQFGAQSIRVWEEIQDPGNPAKSVLGPMNQYDDILVSLTGGGIYSVGYYLDGAPHHFVIQRDPLKGVFELWIDGNRFYTATRSGPVAKSGVVGIAKIAFGTTGVPDRFQGEMDELAIYPAPLDGSLVRAHSGQIAAGKSYERSARVDSNVSDGTQAGTPVRLVDLDPDEFTPGARVPTSGVQTLGPDMPDPLEQFRNAPAPRYATANPPLRKIFNWLDPRYLSGHGQQWAYLSYLRSLSSGQTFSSYGLTSANADRNANIQIELARNFNYGFNVSIGVGWSNPPAPPDPSTPASPVTETGDTHVFKVLQAMKANPSFSRDVIVFGSLYHPNMSGSEIIPCGAYGTCVSPASPTDASSKTYLNGRTQGRVIQSLIATLAETGANGRSPSNAFDRINENGEFSRWTTTPKELGSVSAVSAAELLFARARDPSGVYSALTGSETDSASNSRWRRFTGDRYAAFVSALRDGLKFQSGLSSVNYTLYQVSALSGEAYPYLRSISSPYTGASAGCQLAGGCNAPTADFYPRYVSNWQNRVSAWNGLGFFDEFRQVEIGLGDRLMTPFVSAGWDTRAESNFLPSQYLANLKLLGLLGAESFYSGYFTLGGDVDGDGNANQIGTDTRLGDFGDSRLWAWHALMPSYAQAVISRAVDYLRSGDLLKRTKLVSSEGDTYRIWAGDPRVVVYVRKLTGQSKYLIGSAMQRDSNEKNASPAAKEVTALIDGTPFTFTVRTQGSVFILDRTGASPVVTQLDAWHEAGHPGFWSKTVAMENEVFDEARGVRLRTEMKGRNDFSWFRTSIAFRSENVRDGTARAAYLFQPRHPRAESWDFVLTPSPAASRDARVRVEIFEKEKSGKPVVSRIVKLDRPEIRGLRLSSRTDYRLVIQPLTEGVDLDRFSISPVTPETMALR